MSIKCINSIIDDILPYLPPLIREAINSLPASIITMIEEIRLRQNAPLALGLRDKEVFLSCDGRIIDKANGARIVSDEEMAQAVLLLSDSSFYAMEEELRRGYLTLPGGHRAGLCGRAVLEKGYISTLKEISSINIRVARPVRGASRELLPYIFSGHPGHLLHTLVVSPPRAGKTTILRDIAYQLSEGSFFSLPLNVAVVDERSEIAAMLHGSPQLDIGSRTDVLDACPKAEGMVMLLRSMSPQVIITDEIGKTEDALAIYDAINAGVKVIASAHASDKYEIMKRPVLGELIRGESLRKDSYSVQKTRSRYYRRDIG